MNYKKLAKLYHGAVSEYDSETIIKMVDVDYIQHNLKVPSGRDAFVSFLPKLKEHHSKIENILMLQDGPYIIMYHMWENAEPFGFETALAFHILRFNERGLIAEHWNVMKVFQESSFSKREAEICDLDKTNNNKVIISAMLKTRISSYDKAGDEPEYTKQHAIFGEGNFVLSVCEGSYLSRNSALYDLYRLENGLIVEHWNIYQEIPTEGLANNNTMFDFKEVN